MQVVREQVPLGSSTMPVVTITCRSVQRSLCCHQSSTAKVCCIQRPGEHADESTHDHLQRRVTQDLLQLPLADDMAC